MSFVISPDCGIPSMILANNRMGGDTMLPRGKVTAELTSCERSAVEVAQGSRQVCDKIIERQGK